MVFGVYYHAASLGDYQGFNKLIGLSVVFRMETFFLVSGFFVALISEKNNLIAFIKKRTFVLMLPFLSTLILVNPVTIYLSHGYYNNLPLGTYSLSDAFAKIMTKEHGGPELHLWFLLVLLIYTYMFFLLRPALKKLSAWCERNPSSVALSPITFCIFYAFFWMCFSYSGRLIEYPRLTWPFMEDLPYFFIGVLAGYSKAVLSKINSLSIPLICLGLFGLAVGEFYRGPGWGLIRVFGAGLLSVSIVVTLCWVFSEFLEKSSRLSRMLSSAIYTVYLFQGFFLMGFVSVFGMGFGDLRLIPMLILATVVVFLGVLLHVFVIERFSVLTLLFSGKQAQGLPSRHASGT